METPTLTSPRNRLLLDIIDVSLLALLAYLLTDRFDFSLLVQPTIMTGGDSASWHQIALYLKEDLLPNGRLMGWNQHNFLGYPEFQYYFIPPFLLAVLLSYMMPLSVALKIVSVLGLVLLPLAVYVALRIMEYRRPAPLIGAWLSLLFLFHEQFNMFGGNALSTLAGEFSYSLSFLVQVIFMATLYQGVKHRKFLALNACLLALTGLSHAFVFLTAVLMPAYFWWSRERCADRTRYLVKLYLLAFLLMAFWTFPLLSQMGYTTPIRMIWTFTSTEQLLNMLNYEVLIAAAIGLLLSAWFRPANSNWSFFLYLLLVSAALYFIASTLKIPDIRFFPPILFFSLMLIVDGTQTLLSRSNHHWLPATTAVLLAIIAGGSWLYNTKNNAPDWWKWNLSGYEHKPGFIDGSMDKLRGLLAAEPLAPRVAWEKNNYNTAFGSDRVFESLHLFTGRNSLEGIHYSAALLSKPLTWLLGEYSLTAASPEALVYAHYNPAILPARFRMLNVSDIIVQSSEIKNLLEESPYFVRKGDAGALAVFHFTEDTGGYVATPRYYPQLLTVDERGWQQQYYSWFQREENLEYPLVGDIFVSDAQQGNFNDTPVVLNSRGKANQMNRREVPDANVKLEALDNFEIRFDTDSPGEPHIIKVAYSPNWKSVNGEEIYPVSPGLMLIYPQQSTVLLEYKRSPAEWLGGLLTLLGIALVLTSLIRATLKSREWNPQLLTDFSSILCRYRTHITTTLILLAVVAAYQAYLIKQQIRGDYQVGIKLRSAGDLEGAKQAFLRASSDERIAAFPENPDIPHAITALSWLYGDLKQDDKAEAMYLRLIHLYPNWVFVHHAYNGLAQLYERQGKIEQALQHFKDCAALERFSSVGAHCRRKIPELEQRLDQ
ncbi:MAG: hypothetical protein ACWA5Q_07660 [bacterium]